MADNKLSKKEQHALYMSLGYSAEEALRLVVGQQPPDDPKPGEDPKPGQDPKPGKDPAPAGFDMAPLTKAIGEGFQMLKDQMIANNILGSRQKDQTETTDDIIANIIGPWQPPKLKE